YNQQSVAHNSSLPTPKSPSPLDFKRPQPVVLIPALPPSSQRSDYVELPDNRQSAQDPSVSRRKNRQDEEDAALSKLEGLLRDTFKAEDQLQPDSMGADSSNI